MSAQRNTVQKDMIRRALKELYHPTAEQVYEYIHTSHPSVSKATLYRNLNQMSGRGEVVKVEVPGSPACFDDLTRPHFHGKCRICSGIFDIEMDHDYADALKARVTDDHGFTIEDEEVVFKGICPKCKKTKEEHDERS